MGGRCSYFMALLVKRLAENFLLIVMILGKVNRFLIWVFRLK